MQGHKIESCLLRVFYSAEGSFIALKYLFVCPSWFINLNMGRGKQHVSLGRGYDSITTDLCNWAVAHNPSGPPILSGRTIQYRCDLVTTSDDLMQRLGLSAAATFGTFLDSWSDSLEFYKSYVSSQFSQILIVQVYVAYEPTTLDPQRLTDEAFAALQNGGTQGFYDTYGDCFISDITYGASFYGWLEFQASSIAEYQALQNELQVAVGIFDTDINFASAISQIASKSTLRIKILKVGGTPIVVPSDPNHDAPDINGLIKLAQDFPSEVNPGDDSTYAIVDWTPTLYKRAEHPVIVNPFPDLSDNGQTIVTLASQRNSICKIQKDVQYIVDNPNQFLGSNMQQLASDQSALSSDLTAVDNVAAKIRKNPFVTLSPPSVAYPSLPPLPLWLGQPRLNIAAQIGVHIGGPSLNGQDGTWVGAQNSAPLSGAITMIGVRFEPPTDGLSIHYTIVFRFHDHGDSEDHLDGDDGKQVSIGVLGSATAREYISGFAFSLKGRLKDYFTVKYKGYLFMGGETNLSSDGNLVLAPRLGQGVCFGDSCTDEVLRNMFAQAYFEAIWIQVAYKDGFSQKPLVLPAFTPRSCSSSPAVRSTIRVGKG